MAFISTLQLTYLDVYWEMTKVLNEAVSTPVPASVAKLKWINIFKNVMLCKIKYCEYRSFDDAMQNYDRVKCFLELS